MTTTATCQWCSRLFPPRHGGGRAQRFCGMRCRRAFDAGLRAWTLGALAAGRIKVADLRNPSSTTRALADGGAKPSPAPAVSVAPDVAQGRVSDDFERMLAELLHAR